MRIRATSPRLKSYESATNYQNNSMPYLKIIRKSLFFLSLIEVIDLEEMPNNYFSDIIRENQIMFDVE